MTSEHELSATQVLDVLSKLVHREILKLSALILVACLGFFGTRAIAHNNQQTTIKDAAIWYRRGQQQLARGDVAGAIDSFRRARLRSRSEKKYSLALARALFAAGDLEGAQNALTALRQITPEDPEVNLSLARLAANRGQIDDAVRYYQYALYAPWPAGREVERRRTRIEMIEFLLNHHQSGRAIPDLIALSSDLPDDAAAHVTVGRLFARAGEQRRALDQFERALHLAPRSHAARAGAARATFAMREYRRAADYLRDTLADSTDLQQLRRTAEWVLRSDPWAPRISGPERRRRLAENLRYVVARRDRCLTASDTFHAAADSAMTLRAARLQRALRRQGALADSVLDQGVILVSAIKQAVDKRCPALTARDRALDLIAEQRGVDEH